MLPYIISDYENQGEKELTKVDYNTSVVLRIKNNHDTLTFHPEDTVGIEVASATEKGALARSNVLQHPTMVQLECCSLMCKCEGIVMLIRKESDPKGEIE